VSQYDRAWIAADVPRAPDDPGDQDPEPSGQVALLDGTTSSLTLAAVPGAPDATDDTGAGTLSLRVRTFDADGAQLGEQDVDVPVGTTSTLDPATLEVEDAEAAAYWPSEPERHVKRRKRCTGREHEITPKTVKFQT